MRTLLAVGALALFGMTQPVSAQMCGGGQQAQAQGGGMCGMMGKQAGHRMGRKPAQKPKHSGMCACCSKMAMGGMMRQHHGPGMEPPKRQ